MKPSPTDVQDRASDLRSTPFGHVLIQLLEAEQTGTLLVYAPEGALHAAIFVSGGRPQKALAELEGEDENLAMLLIPLCGWTNGRVEFVEGQDLVGADSPVRGMVDPLPVIAAAARGAMRDELIDQSMGLIARSYIKKGHRLEPARYAFTAQEQQVVAALGDGPTGVDELRNRANVPERVLRRVLYVLRLTRGIGLIPAHRIVSGTVTRPSMPAVSQRPPDASMSERPASGRVATRQAAGQSQQPAAPDPQPPPGAGRSQRPIQSRPPSQTPTQTRSVQPQASRPPSQRSMPAARMEFPMGGDASSRTQPPTRSQQPPAHSQPPTRSQPPPRSQPSMPSQRAQDATREPSRERPRTPSQPSGAYAVASQSDNPRAFRSEPLSSLPPGTPERDVRRAEAENLWRRAEAMAKRSEHEAGLQTAREAMRLGFARPEHDALLGWLIFQHGGGDPSVMPHVWKCLDRALKRESLCEQALYYKALILNLTGQPDQARAHLQRVLMLNPDHAEAAHELRIYELRRAHEQQQSGFLRRLLGGK